MRSFCHRLDRLRLHHGLSRPVSGPHPAGQDARLERFVPGRLADPPAGRHRGQHLLQSRAPGRSIRFWWGPSATISPSIAPGSRTHGVDCRTVKVIAGDHTASCFINTDLQDNQITAFYPGAMAHAASISLTEAGVTADDLVVIAPNDPAAMNRYASECIAGGNSLSLRPFDAVAPARARPTSRRVVAARGSWRATTTSSA